MANENNNATNSQQNAITHPLDQLRAGIRKFVIWDGLLVAALIIAIGYWLGVAFDYGAFKLFTIDWVLDAPKWLRYLGLIIFAALLAACVAYLWYYRLTRTFSYSSLALVLEKRFPNLLGDRLITAVELADVEKAKKDGYSADMVRDAISDASERVKKVPIDTVFNWARLRKQGYLLAGVILGMLLLVFTAYSILTKSPLNFASKFLNISSLWTGRNLFLKDTPWPRKAHLELQEFPQSGELRIGKDAPPPMMKVQAYEWVVADSATRYGWRPLTVGDVKQLTGDTLASDDQQLVDSINAEQNAAVFQKLQAFAGQSVPRTVRRLNIPDNVTLRYAGQGIRGNIQLNRQANNEFAGELIGLKESVQFYVKGDDFATETKTITLVPPPMLQKLTRDEMSPAYLYYPPSDGDFKTLKGLRQEFKGKEFSLTGEKSTCIALIGSEMTITGTADKALKEIRITPKTGKIPGSDPEKKTVVTLKPASAQMNEFVLEFRGENRLNSTVDFEITLVDTDGVMNTRPVTIVVSDDLPPLVEIGVDVLRKKGNEYICTPKAYVPFVQESFVRDDYALSNVQYVYSYIQVEAKEVVSLQSEVVAGIFANSPLILTQATWLTPPASLFLANDLLRANRKFSEATIVPRFSEQLKKLKPMTKEMLAQKLRTPISSDEADVVKEIKFSDDIEGFFDFNKYLAKLRSNDSSGIQPQYRVELNVLATDANYESGPKTGQAVEPIRLLVVSEADLLAEISKDEEGLINKLDDTIKKLKAAQSKLMDLSSKVSEPKLDRDAINAASTRANDIDQDIRKAKDQSAGIYNEYKRLRREAEVNRCSDNVLARFDNSVLRPLEDINSNEFPKAEEAHRIVTEELNKTVVPVPLLISADRQALDQLILKLDVFRSSLGNALSIQKAQEELRKIMTRQESIKQIANAIKLLTVERLFAPELTIATTPFEVKKSDSVGIKVTIDWKVYDKGDLEVLISSTESSLILQEKMTIKDDKDSFMINIKAGTKAGEFKILIKPAVGKAVEATVIVR